MRILTILIAVLMFAGPVQAWQLVGSGITSGSTCSSLSSDSYDSEGAASSYAVSNAARYALGAIYPITSNISVCRVGVFIKKVGSPSSTITAKIYDLSEGFPNNLLGTSSTTLGAADVATTLGWEYFDFSSPVALTSGNSYAIVIYASALGDSSNYYTPAYNSEQTGKALIGYTSSWAIVVNDNYMSMRIYY